MAILAISVAIFAILAPRPRQINLFNGSFWSLGYVDSFDIWTKAGTLKAIQREVKGGRDTLKDNILYFGAKIQIVLKKALVFWVWGENSNL